MTAHKRELLIALCLLIYSCLCFYGGHFGQGIHAYSMVEDDFYYYVRIASNIVGGHGSTFDGQTATNGYHPLWMGVIVLLSLITRGLKPLIAAVYLVAIASTLATYVLSRAILRRFIGNLALVEAAAVLVTVFASDLYRSGMEIIAAIPLALGLIALILKPGTEASAPWSPRHVFGVTLLAAVLVLARIDSAILVALLAVSLLSAAEFRRALTSRHLGAIVLGALPLLAYLASNLVFFHTLLPISGEAKQLRTVDLPSTRGLRSTSWICPLHGLPFWASLLGLVLLVFAWRHLRGMARATLAAVLAFPVAQMLLLSVLSDWILFPWYFYSSAIALCAVFSVVLGDEMFPRLTQGRLVRALATATIAAICLLYAARIVANTWHRPPSQRVMAGLFLKNFAATHPGRYAMGDRAGFAGVVLPYPVVQLEGLTMDSVFLDHIRRQDNLIEVLRDYRVNYYVATQMSGGLSSGCFAASEPAQAGKTAPHMKASICAPPTATYRTPNGITTLVFALN